MIQNVSRCKVSFTTLVYWHALPVLSITLSNFSSWGSTQNPFTQSPSLANGDKHDRTVLITYQVPRNYAAKLNPVRRPLVSTPKILGRWSAISAGQDIGFDEVQGW